MDESLSKCWENPNWEPEEQDPCYLYTSKSCCVPSTWNVEAMTLELDDNPAKEISHTEGNSWLLAA